MSESPVLDSVVKDRKVTTTPPTSAAQPVVRWVPPAQIDQCFADECSMSSVNNAWMRSPSESTTASSTASRLSK